MRQKKNRKKKKNRKIPYFWFWQFLVL